MSVMREHIKTRLHNHYLWLVVGAFIIYRILLDMLFWQGQSLFQYMIGEMNTAPWGLYALSYVVLLILVLLGPITVKRVSEFMYFMFLTMLYIPISSVYAMTNGDAWGYIAITLAFFIYAIFVKNIDFRFSLPQIKIKRYDLILYAILASFLLALVAKFGVGFKFLSLLDVYTVRAQYKENTSRFFGYAISWLGNVLNPWLFARGLFRKNISLVLIGIIISYYLYSITGFKSVFFSLFFVFIVFVLTRYFLRFYQLVFIGLLDVMLMGFVVGNLFKSHFMMILTSLFARRVLMTPGLLYWRYVEFMKTHPLDYFAQHLPISFFLHSHYEKSIPYMIGEYTGNAGTHVNASVFADAVVNLGYGGVFLILALLLFFSILADAVSYNKYRAVVYSILIMPIFAMVNSSIFTASLNHGFLFALLIIYLLPQKQHESIPHATF